LIRSRWSAPPTFVGDELPRRWADFRGEQFDRVCVVGSKDEGSELERVAVVHQSNSLALRSFVEQMIFATDD
jgi:hypothetical protein